VLFILFITSGNVIGFTDLVNTTEKRAKFMSNPTESSKKVEISMRLSEFEIPPMQDILIIGRKAPIGPEAAKRMVNILSPDQYEIKKIEHPAIEAIVIRKSLLNMLPHDKLVSLILEEGEKIVDETMIIKVQLNITIIVSKSIDV
jgi:hypothetical protein